MRKYTRVIWEWMFGYHGMAGLINAHVRSMLLEHFKKFYVTPTGGLLVTK